MDYYPTDEGVLDFAEIEDDGWESLLLGNGMSINVSSKFAYESLRDEIDFPKPLDSPEREIFELFRTTDFELVLGKLQDTMALAAILGKEVAPYRKRFNKIQEALGTTLQEVHPKWGTEVPEETLEALRLEFESYRRIFTTNYDLLLYWATASNIKHFRDCFWSERNAFDPADCDVGSNHTATYYLHGALHLVVEGSGVTRKLTRKPSERGRLLDQFGKLDKDSGARPLLVTEGSSAGKLEVIEENPYLCHAYRTLKKDRGSLLIFGQSLRDQDHHLVDAINANPHRRVAISMHCKSKDELHETRHKLLSKLRVEKVYFFDAATHPLGKSRPAIPIDAHRRKRSGPRKAATRRR